ncbi:androgen-induced gene 1 protein [Aethina tumida]|uniref:androgen-induced gene 1 protein n=1 Tax=Aethina tumida TaxID=116153 RepID=UPI00096B0159|nr:androgen-induced gene 1 protein [Aethina tumida]
MGVRTVLHGLATIHFWFGCYYDWANVNIPKEVHNRGEKWDYSGKLKYLTYWDALLQGFFFTICLLNDLIGSNEVAPKKTPFIRKVKDILLPSLAFPISFFVGATFWALYFIDRELVFPKALDPFFPTWLNHVMHTNIMIFILIELATSFRRYPSRKVGISILAVFSISYLVWIHIIHAKTGFWVYPVLEVLPTAGRIVFFVACLFMFIGFYLLGEKLNAIVWKKQLKQAPTKAQKSKKRS